MASGLSLALKTLCAAAACRPSLLCCPVLHPHSSQKEEDEASDRSRLAAQAVAVVDWLLGRHKTTQSVQEHGVHFLRLLQVKGGKGPIPPFPSFPEYTHAPALYTDAPRSKTYTLPAAATCRLYGAASEEASKR